MAHAGILCVYQVCILLFPDDIISDTRCTAMCWYTLTCTYIINTSINMKSYIGQYELMGSSFKGNTLSVNILHFVLYYVTLTRYKWW